MIDENYESISREEKVDALVSAARYRPKFLVGLFIIGIAVAALEGIGLTFIIPIVEIVQAQDPIAEADGLMVFFVIAYQALRIPFKLGFVIAGGALL